MSWMMGAGFGWLRAGPLGALVGGVAQHFLTRKLKSSLKKNLPGIIDEAGFVTYLTAILVKVCMVKGSISARDAQIILIFFSKNLNYQGDNLKYINKIISEVQRIDPNLERLAEGYKKSTGSNYCLLLLALSYQIVLFNSPLTKNDQECISALARILEVFPEDHNRIRGKYSLKALRTPYDVLAVDSSASNEEVKKAYRQMAGLFHPDKVTHLGQDKVEEAHLKFLEVQAAYRELEKLRGI